MEENEADIYYVDTRNAPDIRTVMGWRPSAQRPSGRTYVGSPQRTGYVTSTAPVYPTQGGMIYPTQAPGYASGPIYVQGPAAAGLGLGGLFGRMTTGQVIDMVAQVFAVLQPLPAAPTALGDPTIDVGNSIKYQEALADYAKRDEQVRTIGNLIAKLVG
jgi:hypothetical protein